MLPLSGKASWTNFGLGLWLIFAPVILAYASVTAALYDDLILGIVIASLALWRALGAEPPAMASVAVRKSSRTST